MRARPAGAAMALGAGTRWVRGATGGAMIPGACGSLSLDTVFWKAAS